MAAFPRCGRKAPSSGCCALHCAGWSKVRSQVEVIVGHVVAACMYNRGGLAILRSLYTFIADRYFFPLVCGTLAVMSVGLCDLWRCICRPLSAWDGLLKLMLRTLLDRGWGFVAGIFWSMISLIVGPGLKNGGLEGFLLMSGLLVVVQWVNSRKSPIRKPFWGLSAGQSR